MDAFKVDLKWTRNSPDFNYKTYDRTHTITLSGGFSYAASAAPEFLGKAQLVNPEEGLLAALMSCHMLTFLAIAANSKLIVDSYEDTCTATLEKNEQGKLCLKNATIKPVVRFGEGKVLDAEALKKLHEKAHANCFIANSIKTHVTIAI